MKRAGLLCECKVSGKRVCARVRENMREGVEGERVPDLLPDRKTQGERKREAPASRLAPFKSCVLAYHESMYECQLNSVNIADETIESVRASIEGQATEGKDGGRDEGEQGVGRVSVDSSREGLVITEPPRQGKHPPPTLPPNTSRPHSSPSARQIRRYFWA